jgi:Uncharacterised nucleotidyltransferase
VPARAGSRATAASNLAIDATTIEVGDALREAGIDPILLKGAGLARLLYDEPAQRGYVDCDLLVAPGAVAGAERVLERLGFRPGLAEEMTAEWQRHASEWAREAGGQRSAVDLHRTLMGARASEERVWAALSARAVPLRIGRLEVRAPDEPTMALHTALHAAQHGDGDRKHMRDLQLALERISPQAWNEAAALARELDATASFGLGLRLAPAGERLADSLGLPAAGSVPEALHAAGAPGGALALERLARSGPRARATLLARTAFPPPQHLRYFHPLARRGRLGLAAAYLVRPLDLARKLPGAVRAWRRARAAAADRLDG